MELLFEFIMELIFEGAMEGTKNRKIPLWLRIILCVFVFLVFAMGFVVCFGVGLMMVIKDNKFIGVLFMLLGLLIVISPISKVIKHIKQRKQ